MPEINITSLWGVISFLAAANVAQAIVIYRGGLAGFKFLRDERQAGIKAIEDNTESLKQVLKALRALISAKKGDS